MITRMSVSDGSSVREGSPAPTTYFPRTKSCLALRDRFSLIPVRLGILAFRVGATPGHLSVSEFFRGKYLI